MKFLTEKAKVNYQNLLDREAQLKTELRELELRI